MIKNKFEINILPFTNLLLGFNYQAAKFQDEDFPEPVDYEEYSIGCIFISITFYRFFPK